MKMTLWLVCLTAGTGVTHTPTTPNLKTAAVIHALKQRAQADSKTKAETDEGKLVNSMYLTRLV